MTVLSKKSRPVKSNSGQSEIGCRLDELTATIRRLDKQAGACIVEIGRRLIEAKALAGHGNWLPWLENQFRWTAETALRFMQVAEAVGKNNILLDLDVGVSSLYLLAAPNTPPTTKRTSARSRCWSWHSVKTSTKSRLDDK